MKSFMVCTNWKLKMTFMVCKKDWKWSPLWYARMIENEVIYGM